MIFSPNSTLIITSVRVRFKSKFIGSIAFAYRMLRQTDHVLEHLKLSLIIYEKSLPSEHCSIASTYYRMGTVYTDKGNLPQALVYFEKAAGIYCQTLSRNHQHVQEVERNIRDICTPLK
jgi:hypothetical protein